MFITFRSIGRSTTLNIPVYEYGVSFKLLVSSSFQKYSKVFSAQIFHFQGGFCAALLGSSRDRDGNDGLVKTVNVPSLPSEATLWLLVLQELWAMPFTTAYKWAPSWEFSLNLSVHLTIGMFPSTLPMPGLGSRAPGIPTYDWSHQGIKLSTTEKNLKRQLVAFSFSLELGELNFPV